MNRQDRLNDELLVLRCQEGDTEAFEALVDHWQRRLWRHAWRLTGDENAAWDALQEAWIGISRGLGRLEDASAFPAWAYRIVSNKCRDLLRRERRHRHVAEVYWESMQPQEQKDAAAEQHHSSLAEVLQQLAGPDRAILSLRYEEQFSTAEIAGILGVPAGTVKSRLFHARKHLREYLEQNDE